jgi:hypothetical protein
VSHLSCAPHTKISQEHAAPDLEAGFMWEPHNQWLGDSHNTNRRKIVEKSTDYRSVLFTPEIIAEAASELELIATPEDKKLWDQISRSVTLESVYWRHDNDDEFFADIRKTPSHFNYERRIGGCVINVLYLQRNTSITVTAPTRAEIERVFDVFERAVSSCHLSNDYETVSPVIFIGHGHSQLWRDLKDHLHDQHGYDIEAYEVGARAGHAVRDILEGMLEKSAFAILVLTGEDEVEGGEFRARQNVVHELGLFQGRLGFGRAIVVLEEKTQVFSNIEGINQIRFPKGRIRESFGDVLAVLRREFGAPSTA